MNKCALRKWAKEERKKLDIEALSLELVQKLKLTEEYKQAKNIMIFYPKSDEVNLLPLLDDETKNFFLPRIEGENLLCCPYKNGEELCVSCFKTHEPISKPVQSTILDLIVVPALAVDKKGYRIGYGGGFYDRFLNGVNTIKLVCIPKEFVVDTVYPEKRKQDVASAGKQSKQHTGIHRKRIVAHILLLR